MGTIHRNSEDKAQKHFGLKKMLEKSRRLLRTINVHWITVYAKSFVSVIFTTMDLFLVCFLGCERHEWEFVHYVFYSGASVGYAHQSADDVWHPGRHLWRLCHYYFLSFLCPMPDTATAQDTLPGTMRRCKRPRELLEINWSIGPYQKFQTFWCWWVT